MAEATHWKLGAFVVRNRGLWRLPDAFSRQLEFWQYRCWKQADEICDRDQFWRIERGDYASCGKRKRILLGQFQPTDAGCGTKPHPEYRFHRSLGGHGKWNAEPFLYGN